nr:MAG: RNA-dependent RNA polymerase [Crogonang virus 67]
MSPFKASVKDEIVGEKKHVLAKNRIFFGGSFFAYLASKQYLGPILSYMHQHGDVFESAIGINCQGPEWANKFAKLNSMDFRKCLDFVNFDLWVKYGLKEKFHNAIEEVMSILRVDELDQFYKIIVHHLLEEFIWMYILIGEEVFQPHSGIPSGMFGTTDLGCFIVSMLYRVVWFSSDEVDYRDPKFRFRSWNWLMTYGDDNASTTKCKWFTQNRMRDVLLNYSIEITSASKGEELLDFTPDNEVTFLKRGFNKITILGKEVVLCPLDEDSIARSVMYTSTPEEIRNGVEASNIFDAQKQYFFHGPEVFADRVPALRKMAEGAGIDISIIKGKWYTFDELAQQYLDGVLVTDYV